MFFLELLVGIILVAVLVGAVLGRFAVPVGLFLIAFGVLPMVALSIYESFFYEGGDTSSMGMFSTLVIMTVAPFGFVVMAVGFFRS